MLDLSKFKDKRICVATSGGVDSTALLHYLKSREKECGYKVSAAHCEHGIRGEESISDAKFVERICKEWDVPLYTFFEDCPARAKQKKMSLETAARDFRYESFAALISENKTDFIALAHHKNDEAETVLFRLSRGSSLSGVRGMSEMNGSFLRPFLSWSRLEIEEYAAKNGLSYCVDQTNFEMDATRNKLRLNVLPALEKAVEGAAENLVKFATRAAEDDELLYEYSRSLLSQEKDGFLVAFCEKKPLFTRACLLAMKALGIEKDYTAAHLDGVFALQHSERGSVLCLPQGVLAEKTQKGILFYRKTQEIFEEKPQEKPFDKNGFDGGRYEVKVFLQEPVLEQFEYPVLKVDEEKLPKNCVFRFRQEGDEIERFGGGRKSLKKFFNEKKTPVQERAYLPLIAEKDRGEVYVVCGIEISEKVKVTVDTKQTLYIALIKKD
jgi:tRNA(Ile)-lysidine synthase